jgi:hypothetical protein
VHNTIDSTVDKAVDAIQQQMGGTERNIRLAIGSAAAAAAIFAPLSYKWKGVLAAVAAQAILTGIYGVSPVRRLLA